MLVVGAKNSGKTSFLNFLRTSLALKPKKRKGQTQLGPTDELEHPDEYPGAKNLHPTFVSQYLETEIEGERVGLTLWDSEGLDKSIVDLQLREMNAFLESKFEETFTEEMKVVRAPGVQDTHIHCVFLVLDPVRLDSTIKEVVEGRNAEGTGANDMTKRNGTTMTSKEVIGGLEEELDVQVLRALQGKTTVVPVISKADTVTTSHMAYLKRAVWGSLKQSRLDLLEALGGDDYEDEEEDEEADGTNAPTNGADNDEEDQDNDKDSTGSEVIIRQSNVGGEDPTSSSQSNNTPPPLPLSILSPDDPTMEHDSSNGLQYTSYDNSENGMGGMTNKVGRKFPWGFADPYNPDHCDFQRLKEAVFVDWRRDLRVASREMWYERWRTERLRGVSGHYGTAR